MINAQSTEKEKMVKLKHVLITGGNKGIGLETTKLFLDKGYKVSIIARDFSKFETLENCQTIEFNLKNTDKIASLINGIENVDILINNAGIMNTYTFDNYPKDKKEEILKVNLEAPIELINCVSKQMIQNKVGRIVNNASIAGQIGHPDIWYGVSKAGLINATKSYAKQLGRYGIVINAVCASPVETEMINLIPENRKESMLKSTYLGRFAEAKEVAETIYWLATESPMYINGTCIDLNNGILPR
jgi:NAD(P)-dependent dehydrogenase (short-subunit alcohol dehydrogenase family)